MRVFTSMTSVLLSFIFLNEISCFRSPGSRKIQVYRNFVRPYRGDSKAGQVVAISEESTKMDSNTTLILPTVGDAVLLNPDSQSNKFDNYYDPTIFDFSDVRRTSIFLLRATLIGCVTGVAVGIFKTSIYKTSVLFFESLASILPKPVFYWPMMLCTY